VERAVTPQTRMIMTTHVSNVTGTIQLIAEIGAIARKHGLLYLVDGAQSAGTLPLDLALLPVDLYAFTGHKGLFGPPGTGGLCIGERVDLSRFETIREGGTGLHCAPDAAKTIGADTQGTIRLSLSYLNMSEQIDLALDGIRRIAASPVA
jgi:selenocysteine lyase/cysteine desulfurase